MYHSVTEPVAGWRATRVDYVPVALALIAYFSAGWIARLHETQGPPAQRVNIRWAADVAPDDRVRAEQELALVLGRAPQRPHIAVFPSETVARGHRTTSQRSAHRGYLSHRTCGTTGQLDRPDVSPLVRTALESDHLDEISLVLTFSAIVFAWCARPLLFTVVYRSASVAAGADVSYPARVSDRRRMRHPELAAALDRPWKLMSCQRFRRRAIRCTASVIR